MYNDLPPVQKKIWEAHAAVDETRFLTELATYVPPPGYDSKGLAIPTWPKFSFNFFSSEMHPKLQGTNPDLSFEAIGQIILDAWQNLSSNEKQHYTNLELQDKTRFNAEMEEYRPQHHSDNLEIETARSFKMHSHPVGKNTSFFTPTITTSITTNNNVNNINSTTNSIKPTDSNNMIMAAPMPDQGLDHCNMFPTAAARNQTSIIPDLLQMPPMESNTSIFGKTSTSSSSCETSSPNCQTIGILKYKFETKGNKSSRSGIASYFPGKSIDEHPQGLMLTSQVLQVGNQHIQGKTIRQLALVTPPSMPDNKFSQQNLSTSVKQGSHKDQKIRIIKCASLPIQPEIGNKMPANACQISASESRSTAMHQLKWLESALTLHKPFPGNAFKDSEVNNAEAQRMEASKGTPYTEQNIIFDQPLTPRGVERLTFGSPADQVEYLPQTLTVPPMFYPLCNEYQGLAGLQNSAPSYDVPSECTAKYHFQGATRLQQTECVPLNMPTMNQYLPQCDLSNQTHISFFATRFHCSSSVRANCLCQSSLSPHISTKRES
jgi:hypothetical protein